MAADLETKPEEDLEDEDSSLTDSALDELDSDVDHIFDEGFGEIPDEEKNSSVILDPQNEEGLEEEDDVEDVDYDSFDDVDEM